MNKRALVRGPVKAFGPDGILRRQRFTIDDAEFLLGKKLVVARRNTRGAITSIWFYGDSAFPHQPRFKAGTRYSTPEVIADARQQWKLKRVGGTADIYLKVLISISANQPTPNSAHGAFTKRRPAKSLARLAV